MKRLIDLEGIASIERGLNLPNRHWAPENDDLDERVKRYSIQHFGRTSEGTYYVHTDNLGEHYDDLTNKDAPVTQALTDARIEMLQWRDYELSFEPLSHPFDEQRPLWEALGWDVTDGNGQPLICLAEYFERPLLAFIKGLPSYGADEPAAEVKAEDWGAALEAEARRFGNGRRR